jgi:hypothetical protein
LHGYSHLPHRIDTATAPEANPRVRLPRVQRPLGAKCDRFLVSRLSALRGTRDFLSGVDRTIKRTRRSPFRLAIARSVIAKTVLKTAVLRLGSWGTAKCLRSAILFSRHQFSCSSVANAHPVQAVRLGPQDRGELPVNGGRQVRRAPWDHLAQWARRA